MTKKIIIRIEFNHREERIIFNAPFHPKFLGDYDLDRHIVDFAITPKDSTKCFTDEEVEAFLLECDEKLKNYEIIEIIKEIL